MINKLPNRKNFIFVSRASSAIYLILKSNGIYGKKILVPANICYAAVYPIIYSGNEPVFCDISDSFGNVSLAEIKKKHNYSAAVIPHMYGNPIGDIERIAKYFKDNNILFIEDCASAMGADVDGTVCGSFGDYSIFSTGYSKTIDAGLGGMIFSDQSLKEIDAMQAELHVKNSQDEANEAFFSKLYRLIRNSKDQSLDTNIWESILPAVENIFINYTPDVKNIVSPMLLNLNEVVETRRLKYQKYISLLNSNNPFEIIPLRDGACPWRFSFLTKPQNHRSLIDYLLNNNVPVSDWYPNVTPLFGTEEAFPNVTNMEARIINLPLLIDDTKINDYCTLINKYYLE